MLALLTVWLTSFTSDSLFLRNCSDYISILVVLFFLLGSAVPIVHGAYRFNSSFSRVRPVAPHRRGTYRYNVLFRALD